MSERPQIVGSGGAPMAAAFAYIRSYYNVPAYVGTEVVFDGRPGTIVGAQDQYLRVLLDDEEQPAICHPTWHMEYVDA